MLGKYAKCTIQELDVTDLINQLRRGEISFSIVQQLAEKQKISGRDFGRIYSNIHDPSWGYGCPAEPIRRSLEYQNKLQSRGRI